jgi:putative ATPase
MLWEALRRCPEGLVAGAVASNAEQQELEAFMATSALDENERPLFCVTPDALAPDNETAQRAFATTEFDAIVCHEPWRYRVADMRASDAFTRFAERARAVLAPEGVVALLQSPPAMGERLSRLLRSSLVGDKAERERLADAMAEAEQRFFGGDNYWDANTLTQAFANAGFATTYSTLEEHEDRLVFEKDIARWFGAASPWGHAMREALGEADCATAARLLAERVRRGPVRWQWTALLSRHVLLGTVAGKDAIVAGAAQPLE